MNKKNRIRTTTNEYMTYTFDKDEETEEEGKKLDVRMERSKGGTKEKRSPVGLSYPNQKTIIINIIC